MVWNKEYLGIATGITALVLLMAGGAGAATVCPSGCAYSSIQDAINAANDGDTITVNSGTYSENVDVSKQLFLIGIDTGGGKPVVDAGLGGGTAITLSAGNSTLDGFEATNGSDAGILIVSDNNIIKNNDANANSDGIFLFNFSNNILSGNNASNNAFGIRLSFSSNNTLISNNASNNGFGIELEVSSNNNTLNGNGATNNEIGIFLVSSSNNTLNGNNANSNNNYGIFLVSSSNNTLLNNIMTENSYNFGLYGGSDSDFNNQIDISNTVDGKPIYYVKNAENAIYDSSTNAGTFYCIDCSNVTVKDMNLYKNDVGILFWNTTGSKIQNVNASNNLNGIYLDSSSNNMLTGNNANSNNDNGIVLWSSSDNKIYHNNLINNTNQAYDNTGTNFWSSAYPSGGNYWSDYTGVDLNSGADQNQPGSDGIGDTPYNISGGAGAQDRYPFMRMNGWLQPSGGFDTGAGSYPSIAGTHNGTIELNQVLTVSKMYTYPSPGTGGHSEYVRIWNSSGWSIEANWSGYTGDWHNITFSQPFALEAGVTYNYTIRTGSYPQIIHKQSHTTLDGSIITSTEFIDANGRHYFDWIPAIKLTGG